VCCPGVTGVSLSTIETVAVSNIQREYVKFEDEASLRRGECSGQYK
jgi:hypothetical protein